MSELRTERGIALPMAIFALVVIGGMVAGSFFIATQEQSVGRSSLRLQQAFAAAEEGAQSRLATWAPRSYNRIATGDSVTFSGTLSTGTGWYRGSIRRLNDLVFLVRSEGFSRDSTARQQVGVLVRLRPVEISVTAALRTQGDTRIGGSSYISGNDHSPGGWSGCPALEPSLAGIQLDPSGQIITSSCQNLSCIEGSPKLEVDSTISDSSLTTFGDTDFDALQDMSTIQMAGGVYKIEPRVSSGVCQTTYRTNWGSPLAPTGACGDYFPIIWVEGDLTVNGVQGQGVLVVNGNLDVQGGFEFYGPIIVRGALSTQGTGGHFNGGVIAANVNLDQNTVLGDAVVNYSSCALARALSNSAPGDMFRERGWINLY